MDDFYAARSSSMPPLPWPSFSLPFSVLVDQETVYAPRQSNDRLLLGLKGSLNEYELDLLRQRSLAARYEKARRGELVVAAPVGEVALVQVVARVQPESHLERRLQEERERVLTGFLTNVTNPKGIVFFVAFLPQFLPATATLADLATLAVKTALERSGAAAGSGGGPRPR